MSVSVQRRAFRRFLLSVIALLLLLVIGTSGYRWLERMTLLDAFYMAVITLSTLDLARSIRYHEQDGYSPSA